MSQRRQWTSEEVEALRRLVSSGQEDNAIAAALTRRFGRPISRASVDSISRRLGFRRSLSERSPIPPAAPEPRPSRSTLDENDPPTLRSARGLAYDVEAVPDIPIEVELEPRVTSPDESMPGESGDVFTPAPMARRPGLRRAPTFPPQAEPVQLLEKDGGGPYVPHPQRGPTDEPHYIPEGHELGGVSRLTGPNGELKGEWSKTRVAGAEEPPVAVPEAFLLDKASVMRRGDGSTVVQWASYKRDAVDRWESIKAAVSAHVAAYVRPADPVEAPERADGDRLTIYPLGDPHIGMLAWAAEVGDSFDLKIAEAELCECMRQLVARSPASAQAIVCNLGDFWHAQDDRQLTPKNGNKLDVDGRAGKVGRVGLNIFRTLIDTALTKHAHVKVRSIPGNHDPQSSFWIPLYLKAVYENDPRVMVEDGFNPYQFDVFGKCLLGWAHGDGAKLEDLGEIMATDVPELWGASSFREWNTGHVHHLITKELRGCVARTHRTLAGRDAWHHHIGYRSGRSLEALTYHQLYGLDSIAVVGIERVRAALGVAS